MGSSRVLAGQRPELSRKGASVLARPRLPPPYAKSQSPTSTWTPRKRTRHARRDPACRPRNCRARAAARPATVALAGLDPRPSPCWCGWRWLVSSSAPWLGTFGCVFRSELHDLMTRSLISIRVQEAVSQDGVCGTWVCRLGCGHSLAVFTVQCGPWRQTSVEKLSAASNSKYAQALGVVQTMAWARGQKPLLVIRPKGRLRVALEMHRCGKSLHSRNLTECWLSVPLWWKSSKAMAGVDLRQPHL